MEQDKTLQQQIDALRQELEALTQEVYRNNFSGHQDFNKFSNFTSRLKIPHHDAIPPTCEVGEIIEAGGALYICSATNSFTLV